MKKILITGAYGFIGLQLLNEFKKSKYKIYTFSRTKKDRLNHFSGDFLDDKLTDNILSNIQPDILIHLAWETTPNKFYENKINLKWSKSTIRFIKKFYSNGGEKFIFSSTCDEYGIKNKFQNIDENCFCRPKSFYGKSKNEVSIFLNKNFKYRSIILRNFFVCGPGENKKKLLSYIIESLKNQTKVHLKRPDDLIDFIDVRDVSKIIFQFAVDDNFGIFNVGSSTINTPLDLTQKIMQMRGISKNSNLIYCHKQKNKIRFISNNSKLKNALKYEIKYNIDRTINDLLKS